MIIILSVLSGTDNAIVLAQAKHLLLRNSSGKKAAALSTELGSISPDFASNH
jgi:hypothetical protein